MTANSPLGSQFNFGWNNKKGKKFKTKTDVSRDKVSCIFNVMCLNFGGGHTLCKLAHWLHQFSRGGGGGGGGARLQLGRGMKP